jgi:phosphatidylinositol alpha-1,6-mannosyltransferase
MGTSRVWICTEDFPPRLGGLSRWSLNAAMALLSHDIEVTVLAKKATASRRGIRVVSVHGHDFVHLRRFHFRRAARKLLESVHCPDRIVASTWHVAEGVIGLGIPVTAAAHGMEIFRKPADIIQGGGRISAALLRLASRRRKSLEDSEKVVCASRFTADAVRRIAPDSRRKVGLNGVDIGLFRADGERVQRKHPLQLISVGRLISRKNFHTVIDLLEKLIALNADAGLWIVGSGPERQGLIERTAGLNSRILFRDNISDGELAALYRSADLFVSPCLSDPASGDVEGFGLTFLEAAACGLPVAGVGEGGVVDAVEHGVSGILTSRESFVEESASLALTPELLVEYGKRGMERVRDRFDIRRVALNLL